MAIEVVKATFHAKSKGNPPQPSSVKAAILIPINNIIMWEHNGGHEYVVQLKLDCHPRLNFEYQDITVTLAKQENLQIL